MALAVGLVDLLLPATPPQPRLAILVLVGAATYGAWLWTFARDVVRELVAIVLKRPLPVRESTSAPMAPTAKPSSVGSG